MQHQNFKLWTILLKKVKFQPSFQPYHELRIHIYMIVALEYKSYRIIGAYGISGYYTWLIVAKLFYFNKTKLIPVLAQVCLV